MNASGKMNHFFNLTYYCKGKVVAIVSMSVSKG